jgi:hypothetical protein
MRRRKQDYRGKLESDNKPLDSLKHLIDVGAPRRSIRLVADETGEKMGLLLAIKPQRPKLDDGKMKILHHEELLRYQIEIAPGIFVRPKITVAVVAEMTEDQQILFKDYLERLALTLVLP